ncbi:cytochrome P450 [Mycolicibacterium sp. CBMA 226]|uniref:cytochrome P450 n=1 Tax=Mycolicibacterium sp. CBMA 226 TaxID=2606611 RepID=UPI0012DD88A7|nr:cytochrome P450 [Mycolicibacterium sp. CBMA 226]MUL78989.1 cytochrome P450 [Mycolicibacterium sp. CBMA 226]QGW61305.1 Cytochrome p450 CYP199A2 [Mycolicibacterium sp.]
MTITSSQGTPPSSDVDPFGADVLEDPFALHAELRRSGRLVHLSRYDVFAMARYDDVRQALQDWQSFQSGAGVGLLNFRYEDPWRPPSLLLEADPPHHDAPRRVLQNILNPRKLSRIRAEWFEEADALVESLLSQGPTFDAVPALARAFPLRVFPDAVGLPPAERENLLALADHNFNALGPANSLVTQASSRVPELVAWAAARCRRDDLSSSGFGPDVWSAADRGDITADQAPLVVRSMLLAGVDTTIHALTAVLYALATHPRQWQLLRSEPDLARVAFDEAVRWQSPVQTFFRAATRDIRVGEHVVPEGKKILMFLGAANRDPRRWNSPDAFDLRRDPSGHVGFGAGIHQCVGQHVGRLEAEALLTALVRRVSTLEVVGTPVRHHNNTLRGLSSLPMRAVAA